MNVPIRGYKCNLLTTERIYIAKNRLLIANYRARGLIRGLFFVREDRRHRKLNLLTRKEVRKQGLGVKKDTKVIIHGFLDHGDVDWIKVELNLDMT